MKRTLLLIALTPTLLLSQGRSLDDGGSSSNIGVTVPDSQKTVTKTITKIQEVALSSPRTWKSNDGKSINGILLAHREKTTKDKKPLIVDEGKIRLLVNQKPFLLPLDRLSEEDQEFIKTIQSKIANAQIIVEKDKAAEPAKKENE